MPNDPYFGQQWAHTLIRTPAAWDITTGSSSITIAIVDSGIDENHPDLLNKIVAGYDFSDGDSNPHDLNGHGTHVAGIAAAASNNATGIAGVNWQARIMPVRVLGMDGTGYNFDISEGIRWAYQHGAKVINLSLGGPDEAQNMRDAVNEARSAGSWSWRRWETRVRRKPHELPGGLRLGHGRGGDRAQRCLCFLFPVWPPL